MFTSYDVTTRLTKASTAANIQLLLLIAAAFILYFMLLEAYDVCRQGAGKYFVNMWNVYDWFKCRTPAAATSLARSPAISRDLPRRSEPLLHPSPRLLQ